MTLAAPPSPPLCTAPLPAVPRIASELMSRQSGWQHKGLLYPTDKPPLCAFDAAGLEEEESGWKYIHGDVFRFPPMKNLFCAFIGTGTQVRGQD